jgi:hypothetical protein
MIDIPEQAYVSTRPEPSQEFMDSLVSVSLTSPKSFLFVKEVLTRMGIKAKHEQRLCQSCHILKKRDRYYIMHFKELFLLDGKTADFTEDDKARRNTIASLIQDWGLVKVDDPEKIADPQMPSANIAIIPHKEKANWTLESKYQIGGKKRRDEHGNR